jgi:hypothetical protein
MTAPAPPRTYHFPPLDRSGALLGLSGRQCAVLGAGAIAAGWLVDRAAPTPLVLAALMAALVLAFARVGTESMCDRLPTLIHFALGGAIGRHRWFAEVPLIGSPGRAVSPHVDLPAFMAGLEIMNAAPAGGGAAERLAGVGVVVDHREKTASATLRVHAGGFCLADRADQERLVAGWGDVLGGFCREGGPVSQVRWTEWLAPCAGSPVAGAGDSDAGGSAAPEDVYRGLMADVSRATTWHDVLVTITVDGRLLSRQGRHRGRQAAATDVLLEELRLLGGRLTAAGLSVDAPLSAAELADAMRRRFDPHGSVIPERSPSAAAAAGVVTARRAAPLAAKAAWSHVRMDSSAHRTFWVAEWPRLDVPPNWIEPLLLHGGGVRTVSVIYEPVPPGRSRRQVDREATKLASDEEQRARAGFRIGARHRRQQSSLVEREAELVAGYGELCFAGFVTVSASSPDELDVRGGDYMQAAAHVGLDLRPLDGRHEVGILTALPVGRGVTRRRMT